MSSLDDPRIEAVPAHGRAAVWPAHPVRRPRPDTSAQHATAAGPDSALAPTATGPDAPLAPAAALSPVWEIVPRSGAVGEMPGMLSSLRRDAAFRRAEAVSDVIAGGLALVLTMALVSGAPVSLTPAALLLVPFVIGVAKALGLYDGDQHRLRKTSLDEAPALAHLAFVFGITVWLAQEEVIAGGLSRGQVVVLIVVTFVLTLAARAGIRAVMLRTTAPERCLLVGNPGEVARIEDKLESSSGVRATVVARLAVDRFTGRGVDGNDPESLPSLLRKHRIERVIVAAEGQDEEEILHCVRLVKAFGVSVSVLPRLLEVVGSSSVFDDVDGATMLGVRKYGLSKSSEVLKRITDVVGASLALIVLGPLLVLIAAAIRLDSKGPSLFRQPRVGRRGEPFQMLKFRTMVDHAADLKPGMSALNEAGGGLFKIADDPRITRVGRILRRASLDELAQLVNVLRGDMSLVGPRPLEPDEDEQVAGWGRRRLAVPPGMTGLWQIFGSARIPMHEMVKIDYLYGANWSIWLDLKVLLRTVPYVLGRRGI